MDMDDYNLYSFENAVIVKEHGQRLDRYLRLKALGASSRAALLGAFGPQVGNSMNPMPYIQLIETSDAYIDNLPQYVLKLKDHPIWDAQISARALVAIANDHMSKTSDRLNAIKELNVIFNITIIDENGKTRAGDFSFGDVLRAANERKAATETKVH